MVIEDIIYGNFEVQPVIAELINSKPFQRLKSVHQGGAIFLVDPSVKLTRYEHSIGVYFLVKKFGGSIEEQIAALLHDVSHTAFSHVTDYVFENRNEDYHELIFHEVINQSEIPAILEKHGFDISILESDETYTILEKPLPDLCADRLDYTLRDLFHIQRITLAEINAFLGDIVIFRNQMAVSSQEMADWITQQFKVLNEEHFSKKEHVYANTKLAELLRHALKEGTIEERDFWKDDFQLLEIMLSDAFLKSGIENISQLKDFGVFEPANYRFKKRELKPLVVVS